MKLLKALLNKYYDDRFISIKDFKYTLEDNLVYNIQNIDMFNSYITRITFNTLYRKNEYIDNLKIITIYNLLDREFNKELYEDYENCRYLILLIFSGVKNKMIFDLMKEFLTTRYILSNYTTIFYNNVNIVEYVDKLKFLMFDNSVGIVNSTEKKDIF